MENVKVACTSSEMGYALHCGSAGSDDPYSFVGESFKWFPCSVSSGVVIVPSSGVEHVPFEIFNSVNSRKFWVVHGSGSHSNELSFYLITLIGSDYPSAEVFVPAKVFYLR